MTGGLPRRGLLVAVGAAAVAGCSGRERRSGGAPEPAGSARVDPYGATQAGIISPGRQQGFVRLTVLDRTDPAARPGDVLDTLGGTISRLVAGRDPALPEPGDLTVTVGLGRRMLPGTVVDGARLRPLPAFARDEIPAGHDDGDLVLQVCASDPVVTLTATSALRTGLPGFEKRWDQFGFTAAGDDGVGRNVLGFHDGIVQPRGRAALEDSVWLDGPGLEGSTLMVVRRVVLDVERFTALAVADQEAVIGREKRSGAPLSGGDPHAPVDLTAKTPAGAYRIPAGAHVRRAHPLATGRPLMLRRGYSFADADGSGLLFLSFQRDLDAFVQTQYRLDAGDELMRFTRVTASGAFWVPPGPDRSDRGWGGTVLG